MQKFLLSLLMLVAMATPSLAQVAPAGAVHEDASAQKLRFYGFALDLSVFDSSGINGTYYTNTMDFYFLPSWTVGRLAFKGTRFERLTLGGRFTLSRPLAGFDEGYFSQYADQGRLTPCSNLTPSAQGGTINPADVQRCSHDPKYRWDYGDVQLTLANGRLFTIPGIELNINPTLIFTLPTSAQSRFATLRLGLGASLGVSRAFLEGKVNLRYTFNATKNFHQYTSPRASAEGAPLESTVLSNGYTVGEAQSIARQTDPYFLTTTGAHNPSYGFSHIFGVDITATEALSFTVMYILRQSVPYGTPCTVDYGDATGIDTCANGAAVAGSSGSAITQSPMRVSQIFWLTAGYQVTDWLNVSASFVTASPQRKPDGSLRQPFLSIDANGFSSVSLGATLSIDHVLAKLIP